MDRTINLGALLGLLVQTAAIVWWAAGIDSRLDAETQKNERQAGEIAAIQRETQQVAVSIATLNAQLSALSRSLDEVKDAQRETNELLRALQAGGN